MLAGRGPFDHVTSDELVLNAHATDEPEPPSRFAERPIPPELDQAVLKALNKDPEQRFSSAADFEQALHAIEKRLDAEPRASTERVSALPPRRHSAPPDAEPAASAGASPRRNGKLLIFLLMTIAAAAASASLARVVSGGSP
jgi:eukaryotic-like serine/threonine-protein kinase